MQRRYESRKRFLSAVKTTAGCADCGYMAHPAALDFDHLEDKRFKISATWSASMSRLTAEIAKCEVVCSNCHRIRTLERKLSAAA